MNLDCNLNAHLLAGCTEKFDETDLGKAMAICESHRDYTWTTSPPSKRWPAAWESCYKVHSAWQNSERAQQLRQYEIQTEKDRQSIIEFSKGLK